MNDSIPLHWIEDPPRPPLSYGRPAIHAASWPSRVGDTKLLFLLALACVQGYRVRIAVDVIGGVAGVFTGTIERVSLHSDHADLLWLDGEWRTTRPPRVDDGALRDGPYHASMHIAYITELELTGHAPAETAKEEM